VSGPHPGRGRRAVLIVNPFATGVDEHRIALVEKALGRGAEVSTFLTERRGHATELAREGAEIADAIFVFSGDGGFNEALNGLGRDAPPLGCIPGGGTSVLPRALGLPRDPVEAAERLSEALAAGRTRTISVGSVNGRRFGFNAGIGFDAELVRRIEAHRSRAGRPGDVAFVLTLMRLVAENRARFRPALEIEGLGRAAFAFVANTDPYTFVGAVPLHVAPAARFEGGLDLVAPRSVRPRDIPRLVRYAATGRGQLDDRLLLTAHDLDRLEIRCDRPLPLQVDGEDLGDVTEAIFVAERAAVRVLV
jgi:diacylglycerol kinase family enzyme